jgi:hypothetical protein
MRAGRSTLTRTAQDERPSKLKVPGSKPGGANDLSGLVQVRGNRGKFLGELFVFKTGRGG